MQTPITLSSDISVLKGIGEKTREPFYKAGIHTLSDLLSYYPGSYETYALPIMVSALQEGETAAVRVTLRTALSGRYLRGLHISSAIAYDETGELTLTWFNMPFLKNSLKTGKTYIFRGKIKQKGGQLVMEQPAVYAIDQYQVNTAQKTPHYALVKGLTNAAIIRAVKQALDLQMLRREYLPLWLRQQYHLCEYNFAIEQIHFPQTEEGLLQARRRLVFDEFFFFLLQLRYLRERREKRKAGYSFHLAKGPEELIKSLPYELTGAQRRVWDTIQKELCGESAMARLIQGDVGSGKTIVSILALIMTAENGYQGALMVPTEVLASQHFQSVTELLAENGFPYQALLLTGSLAAREKREALEKIQSGQAQIIIGTHALIQEAVHYKNLALVITDEQHRFGVRQRESLAEKGQMPHTIVMSATPIPRTLAVILYGDLDISVINEMPASRLPIKNCVVDPSYRKSAARFITGQVQEGHQAYVICPMVEESEMIEAENVLEYTEKLQQLLPPEIRVEYLHGKMKPKEKNEIMERFVKNEIQVLVSTTVIEVGVNVPNATVMMVENAERFGLAQLHQLRGRVGRGSAQSYCIFVQGAKGEDIRQRLDILNHSNDGFEIANKDLQLRGPGDLFGVRQSGMLDFSLADIYSDAATLAEANEAVQTLLEKDPGLTSPDQEELLRRYQLLLEKQSGAISL